VRLVAFCQTAIASGRQVVTKEMKDKSPKTCINKGSETYFQKSLMTYLQEKIHIKFSMTNETDMPV